MVAHRGNPNLILRLRPKELDGLRTIANQEGRTVSDVVRDEIYKLLDRKGIDYKTK